MTSTAAELIAEARFPYPDPSDAASLITRLADALEAATQAPTFTAAEAAIEWLNSPRVVSTVAELDALPDMSIIRAVGFDDVPGAFEKAGDLAWYETGRELPVPDAADLLPATVLWVGGTE